MVIGFAALSEFYLGLLMQTRAGDDDGGIALMRQSLLVMKANGLVILIATAPHAIA